MTVQTDNQTRSADGSKTAIIVCHGMGKQVRYETLDCVVKAVKNEHEARSGVQTAVTVDQVKFGDNMVPRAKIELPRPGGVGGEAHVYEAYWAPLTEGKVTARDVTRFLATAAWKGIRNSRGNKFDRWMFGGLQPLRFPRRTVLMILGTFFVLLLLGLLYAALLASATAYVTEFVRDVSSLGLSALWKSIPNVGGHPFLAVVGGWVIVLWIAHWVRSIYIQYVGDVAAYVSSHDVSKFNEIRGAIQTSVCDVMRHVYQATGSGGGFLYDRVIVAGHSLGSVVAYDALNRLISEDIAIPGPYSVTERTSLFLTFGSPLDKTAFIFRTQIKGAVVREECAATKQPMILDYAYRPQRWINIYSPADPVSGELQYYDLPAGAPASSVTNGRRVQNMRDPQARAPIVAHNHYWRGAMLGRVIYDAI